MCNLHALTKSQDEIRRLFEVETDRAGNLPPLPGIFPNTAAPDRPRCGGATHPFDVPLGHAVASLRAEGQEDPGVTNARNTASPHWRRLLAPERRCLVPLTSFSENEALPDGTHPPVWFALAEDRPLACFASINLRAQAR